MKLIQANIKRDSIPCLNIQDWPSLRYRGFQDDITRGPSPKLETLKHEIRQATLLKMNFFTYYLEHQFAINPTCEESYQLLDDLYYEQAQIIESKFFNVSCGETFDLGTGPSKSLAEKIGVGGVDATHMKRIHDLLKNKYKKCMMMWV